MADLRGANLAWTPGPPDADGLPMLSLSKSPLRNLNLPRKLKRLRDLFTISSGHSLRFGDTSVLRFETVARVGNKEVAEPL